MDLVIKNGIVVTAADVFRADVGIVGEKIVALGQELQGREEIDANGLYVFPGFIDAHVHLSLPAGELISSDDFTTGTIAAACGGTTTVLAFVTPERGQSLHEAVCARRAEADGCVAVDYSLHLTAVDATERTRQELAELSVQGYTSLKLYTTYPAVMTNDEEMLLLLETCRQHRILPIVHTENHAAIEYLKARLLAAGYTDPTAHPRSRPPLVEAEAAQRVLTLAALTDCPMYIVHLTCLETLAAVEQARARGQRVYAEVCPQHLLLSEDNYARPDFEGAKYVLSPPLRDKSHWEPLWRALAAGRLDTVATDHCPWTLEQKALGQGDFTKIPNGAPGVETRVPLMYHYGVNEGRLTLQRFVEACATAPARLFGLYPRKGTIVPGSDADLVLFDPQREVTLSYRTLHQRVDYCPYEGWTVRGYPVTVLVRGRVVVRDMEFVGQVGWGQFLARRPFLP